MPGESGRELTYAEVGASRGPLPAGYRHLKVERMLGSGDATFRAAADRLLRWDMHRAAGLRIAPGTPPAAVGLEVRLEFGFGPLRLPAWCRVVDVVDEPDTRGFTYGTLTGHPEIGEETFLVERGADGVVRGRVVAFSRHGRWYTKIAGPVGHLVQRRTAQRYLDALAGT